MAVEQGGVVASAGDDGFAIGFIEDAVGHADEHVLADVGEELAVDGCECGGGRGFFAGDRAQGAAAHCHEESGWDALARDIGDGDAEAVCAEFEVVVIVAADDAGGEVGAADAETGEHRVFLGEEHALDFAGVLQLVFHRAFLVGLAVDARVADRE